MKERGRREGRRRGTFRASDNRMLNGMGETTGWGVEPAAAAVTAAAGDKGGGV